MARLQPIPFLLAAVVGALSVLTLVHVMVTSVHRRRRDVAVLRSLEADAPFITGAVHWQATSFSLVPLILGAPLGLVAGRLVFGAFADRVGTVPSASFPYAWLGALIAAFVVLANLVAAVPAYRARRLASSPVVGSGRRGSRSCDRMWSRAAANASRRAAMSSSSCHCQ